MRRINLLVLGLGVALISTEELVGQDRGGQVQTRGQAPRVQVAPKPEVKTRPEPKAPARVERLEPRLPTEAERVARLERKMTGVLPAGTNINEASIGFRSHGQFIAAAHVSKNLGIPFAELKARMTGEEAVSLGRAIHELRPDLDVERSEVEARKAEKEAALD